MINKTKMMILAAMIGTSIVACKDDKKDDAATPNYSVVGTWNESMSISTNYANGVSMGTDTTTYAPGESVIELRADGMMIFTDTSSIDTGIYTYSGNTLTVIQLERGVPVDTMSVTISFSGANTMKANSTYTDQYDGTIYRTDNVSILQKVQ
jgi:hypothetical protein